MIETFSIEHRLISIPLPSHIRFFSLFFSRLRFRQRTDHVEIKEADADGDTNGRQLSTSRSTLTVTPNAEDNGIVYSCEGHHPALSEPLRQSVALSVLYPPAAPEISGYVEGETVRMGDTLTLVCKSQGNLF